MSSDLGSVVSPVLLHPVLTLLLYLFLLIPVLPMLVIYTGRSLSLNDDLYLPPFVYDGSLIR